MKVDRRSDGGALSLPVLVVDQGLYSASNFAVAALAGRTLDVDGFGRFALYFLAIAVAVALARAIAHEPDLALASSHPSPIDRFGPGPLTLGSLAATSLAATLALGSDAGGLTTDLVIMATATMAALAQDRARYRAIADRRAFPLVAGDAVFLLVILVALANSAAFDTPAEVLRLWLVGAALGVVPHLVGGRTRAAVPEAGTETEPVPSVGGGRRVVLLTDFLLVTGMTQIGGLVIGFLLAADQFAALRGAIILLGPVGVLIGALNTWLFSAVSTSDDPTAAIAPRAGLLAGLAAGGTLVVGLVPTSVGMAVLGSGWPPRTVLLLIGLSVSCQALSTPGMMLLRLLDDRRRLLTLRLSAFAAFAIGTSSLAVATGSATAVAAGYLAVNASLALAVWFSSLAGRAPAEARSDTQGDRARGGDDVRHDATEVATGP